MPTDELLLSTDQRHSSARLPHGLPRLKRTPKRPATPLLHAHSFTKALLLVVPLPSITPSLPLQRHYHPRAELPVGEEAMCLLLVSNTYAAATTTTCIFATKQALNEVWSLKRRYRERERERVKEEREIWTTRNGRWV